MNDFSKSNKIENVDYGSGNAKRCFHIAGLYKF